MNSRRIVRAVSKGGEAVAASAAGRLVARIRRPFRRRASIGWNSLGPARPGFAGLPTAGEAVVAGLVGAAILTSSFLFPSTAGYSSFSGVSTDGSFQWGPGLGWYFAFAAVTLAAYAAVVGFLVDRKLVGICWFCYRPATGPRCTYCGSILRRSRPERNRGGPTAESVAAPNQK